MVIYAKSHMARIDKGWPI